MDNERGLTNQKTGNENDGMNSSMTVGRIKRKRPWLGHFLSLKGRSRHSDKAYQEIGLRFQVVERPSLLSLTVEEQDQSNSPIKDQNESPNQVLTWVESLTWVEQGWSHAKASPLPQRWIDGLKSPIHDSLSIYFFFFNEKAFVHSR